MRILIATHGKCDIGELPYAPFQTLANSIMGQQLSTKAAHTIRQRVLSAIGKLQPGNVLAISDEILRRAGLSRAKARYIKELAASVQNKTIDLALLPDLSDEEVTDAVTKIPGIGRWTAEMFLIFGLKRTDVFSTGDVGLQRAIKSLFGETEDTRELAERWRPYRTVACWYLWEHLDNKPK